MRIASPVNLHSLLSRLYFSFFINMVMRSIGIGNIKVLFFSEAISVSVCR